MAKKKGFGVVVSFAGDKTTLEELFGKKPIISSQMFKLIWVKIKEKKAVEDKKLQESQKSWVPKAGERVKFLWSKDKKWYPATIKKANGSSFVVEDVNDSYKVGRKDLLKVA